MNKILVLLTVAGLLLIPLAINAQTEETAAKPPPVGQVLIPEGDFALKLTTSLNLGTPGSEAEAESMLTAVGIAPKNGWIADYPMTPVIIGELQNTIVAAAAAKKLPMGKDEAIKAFQDVTTEFGLFVAQGTGEYGENQPPSGGEYIQPPVVNNYYYSEGPPVVTYYPPPWDYDYLYAWVPYPFWYTGFFFPGFFILNDFDVIVVSHGHHHHRHQITNHFIDPKTRTVHLVDPGMNRIGTSGQNSFPRTPRFNSPEARRGAASIFERGHQSQGQIQPGNVPRGIDNRGFGQSNNPQRRSDFREGRTFSAPSSENTRPLASSPNDMGSRNSSGSSGSPRGSMASPASAFSAPRSDLREGRTFSAPSRENTRSFAPSPNYSGSRNFGGSPGSPRGSMASPGRAFSAPRSFSGESHGGSIGHSFSGGFSHGGGSSHGGGCRGRC